MIDNSGKTESLEEAQKQCPEDEIDTSGSSIEVALRLTKRVFSDMIKTVDMFLARVNLIPKRIVFQCELHFSSDFPPITYADINPAFEVASTAGTGCGLSCDDYNKSIVINYQRFMIDPEKGECALA